MILVRGQVAPVDVGHFVSKINQLTIPQCPDEGFHPATPAVKAVEEVPDGVLVPLAFQAGSQEVLVTWCEARQLRQNLYYTNTVKFSVIMADMLESLVLGKRHHCSGSE